MTLPDSLEQDSLDLELLDRWVDGEVDAETFARLLAQCEASPGAYRQVALAFFERQQWRECLRNVRSSPHDSVIAAVDDSYSGRSMANRSSHFAATIACGLLGIVVGISATWSILTAWSLRQASDTVTVSTDLVNRQLANRDDDSREFDGEELFAQQTLYALRQAGVDWEERPHVYLVHGSDGTRWAVSTHQVVFRYDHP